MHIHVNISHNLIKTLILESAFTLFTLINKFRTASGLICPKSSFLGFK